MNAGESASQERFGTLSLTGTSMALCSIGRVANYCRPQPGTPGCHDGCSGIIPFGSYLSDVAAHSGGPGVVLTSRTVVCIRVAAPS
jgi:hypothetical protein